METHYRLFNKMKRLALAFIFLLGMSVAASATDAYVSPAPAQGGTGAGSACTSVAPCATIALGSAVVTAGGTVFVSPGLYPGGVLVTKNGSAGNIITYQCTTRGACKIIPGLNESNSGVAFYAGNGSGAARSDYVTIDGFEIDGSDFNGGTEWRIGIFSYGDHVTISHNIVHDIARHFACGSSGGSGIQIDSWYGAANGTIDSNVVHDVGPSGCNLVQAVYASSNNELIQNNLVYNINGACITQWHNVTASTIVNNTCVNTRGLGLGVGEPDETVGAPGARGKNVSVQVTTGTLLTFSNLPTVTNGWAAWNDSKGGSCWPANTTIVSQTGTPGAAGTITISNTITCTVATSDLLDFMPISDNNIVSNNILAYGVYGYSDFGALGINNVRSNNLTFGNLNANSVANGQSLTNNVSTAPQFVGGLAVGPGGDFRLLAASPAKFGGTNTNKPTLDITGRARPNPPSIGAFEFITPSALTALGPGTIGSSVGSAGAGNPAAYGTAQLTVAGYGNLSNYGACLPLINTNPGAITGNKTFCVDNAGTLVVYGFAGQKLWSLFENGSAAFGQYANPHGNIGATCFSNLGLPAAGGLGIVQNCRYTLATVNTTSASAKRLTADTLTAGSTNCINMPDNSAGTFSYQFNAIDMTTPANTYGVSVGSGLYKRGAGVGTMVISGLATQVVTASGTTTGAALALTADTTNGCFNFTFTNPATADVWSSGLYVDIIESPPD